MEKLKVQQASITAQVGENSALYDSKRAQLQENDTYNQLASLESKLKQVECVNFGMKDCMSLLSFHLTAIIFRYCIQDSREQL